MTPVPAGAWAIGASGGADSVALLSMLRRQSELQLHVVHIDHQTRGRDSAGDADFVENLARQWGIPFTKFLRSEIECEMKNLPRNRSARFRDVRMEAFRRVVAEHKLTGVLLAHHADDLAETVLQRLLRGSGARGLAVMPILTTVRRLQIFRPLLKIRRSELRVYLTRIGQTWREDASNQSPTYFRNRLRKVLAEEQNLQKDLLELAECSHRLRTWVAKLQKPIPQALSVTQLQSLPHVLAAETARRWLIARGTPAAETTSPVVDRLLDMASDAASPPRAHFPGKILVRRKGGKLLADTAQA